MKVILLPLAQEDLQEIKNYLSKKSSQTSKNIAAKIKKSLQLLSEQPYIGHTTENENILEWHIPKTRTMGYSLNYGITQMKLQVNTI